VASYPLAPASVFPTFLMDFSVFPGNSGGPVFMAEGARRRPGSTESQEVQFVAGMLTQQVELTGERLEIGIVTHAKFIRETVAMLDKTAGPPVVQAKPAVPVEPATQAAAQNAVAVSATAVAVAR
jgi:S1-C subfamily serine protease